MKTECAVENRASAKRVFPYHGLVHNTYTSVLDKVVGVGEDRNGEEGHVGGCMVEQ